MDQLFKALPRDIQWDILTEFTGTHSVRKGKLLRKIVFDNRHQILQDMIRIQSSCAGLNLDFYAKAFVQFSTGARLMFCHDPKFGGIGYMFISSSKPDFSWMPDYFSGRRWTPINIWTGITTPFVKHSYQSYEHTDKKKESSDYR